MLPRIFSLCHFLIERKTQFQLNWIQNDFPKHWSSPIITKKKQWKGIILFLRHNIPQDALNIKKPPSDSSIFFSSYDFLSCCSIVEAFSSCYFMYCGIFIGFWMEEQTLKKKPLYLTFSSSPTFAKAQCFK